MTTDKTVCANRMAARLPGLRIAVMCLTVAAAVRAADVAARISGIQWAESAQGAAIVEDLLAGGETTLAELCALIREPGQGDDTDARFALHGLALAVQTGARDADRQALARSLLAAAQKRPEAHVRAFFIRQLELVAGDESVPALSAWLADEHLCGPAARALVSLGTPAAAAALVRTLPGAQPEQQLHLVQAVGDVRAAAAVDSVLKLVLHEDENLRLASWYALANIGDPRATDVLVPALQQAAGALAPRAERLELLFAERLAENGHVAAAVRLLRDRVEPAPGPRRGHASAAALDGLVAILGTDALADLVTVLATDDVTLREAALRHLATLPGAPVTQALLHQLEGADAAMAEAVVAALGRRGDAAALPALEQALTHTEQDVRHAAMTAIRRFGANTALPRLLTIMRRADSADCTAAAAELLQLNTATFVHDVSAALDQASAPGRMALLNVLAARGAAAAAERIVAMLEADDKDVRVAAYRALETTALQTDAGSLVALLVNAPAGPEQDACRKSVVALARRRPEILASVLERLPQTEGDGRRVLIQTLGRIGGNDALDAVVAEVAGGAGEVRDEAVRTLARWPDASAAPHLLTIARTSDNRLHRALALKGVVDVVQADTGLAVGPRVNLLGEAMAAAHDDAERKRVLGALGAVRHADALALVAAALGEAALKEEAAAAAVGMICPRDDGDKGMRDPAAFDILRQVVEVSGNQAVVDKARAHLQTAPPPNTANVALGKPVTISAQQQSDHSFNYAVDGKLDKGSCYWGDRWPSWLQIDLKDVVEIDTVRIIFYWDGRRYYQYKVAVSVDGENWTEVVDNAANTTPATAPGLVHRFSPVKARYVRLHILKNSVNEAVHVVEFEVYAPGRAPERFASSEPAPPPPPPPLPPADAEGFIPLFNGADLSGWIGAVNGYAVEDGVVVSKAESGGTMLTAHQFADFILRFEFKLTPGANNGLAIRAPSSGNPAYAGMELQILDNTAEQYANLQPYQFHGSIYGVVPAERGHLKPVGEWNVQEVRALGRRITVVLNDHVIVDADLGALTDTADGKGLAGHPGLARDKGHIGFMGHGARVAFRNIRIKPIEPYTQGPHNVPPEGFTALFNGRDLSGWRGLVGNPKTRAAMSAEELAAAQRKADEVMQAHWRVDDGMLVFDGHGSHLCTDRPYGDFEMLVDWKIESGGDSGIYLRGSPQVQIWDPAQHPEGSGGLYNNKQHPRHPLVCADHPVGQWNRFRIRMVGERVTVWLNGERVVDNVVMENYWDRSKPIYPSGQIELQSHGSQLYFRNVFIREIPREQ